MFNERKEASKVPHSMLDVERRMLRSRYETYVVLLSLGLGHWSKGSSERGKETDGFKY
jgi:hypothetical protein